jgi:hypothetical protein
MKRGWWSIALLGYHDHPHPTTYSLFDYDNLPPIEIPDKAGWDWLAIQPRHEEWSLADNCYPDGSKPDLSHFRKIIAQSPYKLPEQFINFIETPSLHERIRSATACMLELSDYLVSTSTPPYGIILQFLVDQQGCMRWHLFADVYGNQAVLVSWKAYGINNNSEEPPRDRIDLLNEDVWYCAPNFTEFMFRYWLENEIFFTLINNPQKLNDFQREYLRYYR